MLQAIADRLPSAATLLEETPSSRPELHARIPATEPLGFVSAMGMLGFALPAAVGLKLARPEKPVLTVTGDGSSLYQILSLWSAATYEAGVLFVVLVNGGTLVFQGLPADLVQLGERGGTGDSPAERGYTTLLNTRRSA